MLAERLQAEEEFHDRQASERSAYFAQHVAQLIFSDEEYLDHESWIQPAFAKLGDVHGKQVLDYGCGHGMAAVVLARRGAIVSAFDLSSRYVDEAQMRARANGVALDFRVANAEELPYPARSFDAVWGNAILHHLDLPRAGRELFRILKPDGIAVFCEPWGGNPLLNWARRRLPYRGKGHTPDERPLRLSDLEPLRQVFSRVDVQGFQLLRMLGRAIGHSPALERLHRWDTALLRRLPFLENWCRYMVIALRS